MPQILFSVGTHYKCVCFPIKDYVVVSRVYQVHLVKTDAGQYNGPAINHESENVQLLM